MTDRAGEQLDQYQLLRLLGQGAFGKVYLAEHLHQHTRVAIKVLTMQVTQEMLEEFLHEARVLFLLKHPSIIPLLDFGLANKTPFMVIEYAPHGTLRHRHPPGVRVPLEMVNTYVQQVASALQYAHEQRLIHRDVKPQNMLLNQQGQVLLSDFGIATIAHSEGSLATQGMAGTIPYMAPEQIQGKPRPASDQYALAICAYEWLCGVRPFSGSTVELIGQHLSADPPALRRHLPEMPEVIEEVVLHALAKDPQQRFASVAAFATAFQQAIWPQEHQRLRVPDVVSLLSLDPVDSSKTSPSPAVLPGEAHADNVTPLLSPSSEVPAPSGLPGTNIPSPPTEQHPALIAEKPAILHPFPRILTPPKSPHRRPFLVKVIALITALIVLAGGGLQFFFSFHHTTSSTALAGLPMLILSASVVRANQDASLHLANFLPRTTVVLTHDVQEPLLNTANTSSLITDASGQANSSFTLSNWTPGFHQIVAEDVTTRDTASALLQISDEGFSRTPHLLLDSSSLHLGSDIQGTNTIHAFALHNTGSGSIIWSASSDQSWLFVAPLQGTFSSRQTIAVAAQRNHLPSGDYTGTITIFSNVGAPQHLSVHMTVKAPSPDSGPMISVAPPLLSFTATDGTTTPLTQALTLSNPGQQELSWSLAGGQTSTAPIQNAFFHQADQNNASWNPYTSSDHPGGTTPWISVDQTSGSLLPGRNTQVNLTVHSHNLLPGVYLGTLTLRTLHGVAAYDGPQPIEVALTIQPQCGLVTNTGSLAFTAVAGQNNPGTQTVSIDATASCSSSTLDWQATPSANWITVGPKSQQVKGTTGSPTSLGVKTTNLSAGRYSGLVTFQAGKDTQTVMVQLNLQPDPAPSEPIIGTSPLSLNFSAIQGQTNPAGQVLTVTNDGKSLLKWNASVSASNMTWLTVTPVSGTIPGGQTGQMTVKVKASGLTPGNYTGQIAIGGRDTHNSRVSGNPQTITVDLAVQIPCLLAQPSTSSLRFNGIAGGPNPVPQTVALMGDGGCTWPLHWTATSDTFTPSWLVLTLSTNSPNSATQQGTITVGVITNGLAPGTYTTQVKINVVDTAGKLPQSAPQLFSVTLTVRRP